MILRVVEKGQEKKYPLSWEDITVGRLRQIKAWFPELGAYIRLVTAIQVLDPDAALCAVWIARKAAGEANPPDPNQMDDFPLNVFLETVPLPEEDEEEAEADPTSPAPTLSSTRTRRKSADDTSDS